MGWCREECKSQLRVSTATVAPQVECMNARMHPYHIK
jgi:hypothetical protein